jgi:hypothetical protein
MGCGIEESRDATSVPGNQYPRGERQAARRLRQAEPLADAIEAYKAFDRRESGWVKVELRPEPKERKAA